MLVVKRGEGKFVIENDSLGQQSMFVVVRNVNSNAGNRKHKVLVGDVLKLGRIKFKVKAIQAHGRQEVCNRANEDEGLNTIRNATCNEEETCKICWMNECDATNPLISACQCDGSMKMIHLNCLRQWITEKCHRREVEVEGAGTVVTWTWR